MTVICMGNGHQGNFLCFIVEGEKFALAIVVHVGFGRIKHARADRKAAHSLSLSRSLHLSLSLSHTHTHCFLTLGLSHTHSLSLFISLSHRSSSRNETKFSSVVVELLLEQNRCCCYSLPNHSKVRKEGIAISRNRGAQNE